MDNLCHSLCGLALARLLRTRPRGTTLLVTATNAPDLDVIVGVLAGRPAYLIHHRGITHALLGLAVEALLLATVFRWRAPAARFASLLGLAALGLLSHLGLDALNSYGVRPWLPFSASWCYSDVAFIVDPWLWLLFGAAALFGAPRGEGATDRGGRVWLGYAVFSIAGLAVSATVTGRASHGVTIGYAVGILGAALLRLSSPRFPRGPRSAAAFLLAALGYLAALAGLGTVAKSRALRAVAETLPPHATVIASALMPAAGVPWRFVCLVATGTTIHSVHVDLLEATTLRGATKASNLDSPLLERVRLSQEFLAWRVFSRLPYVQTTDSTITLGDARYEDSGFCTFTIGK